MIFTVVLSVFMFGAAAFVVFTKELINGLIAMSVFSMMLVVYYFLLHAPDVAITEAALGAGLSTIIFLIAIRKIKEKKQMVDLRTYFSTEAVRYLQLSDSKEIAAALIDTALKDLPQEKREEIKEILQTRKQIQEINIGKGIALAHERLDELEEMYISLGLLEEPVKYGRGPAASLVLCVLLPNSKSREYLSMMARFTRFMESHEVSEFVPPAVKPAVAEETFLQVLSQFEDKQG